MIHMGLFILRILFGMRYYLLEMNKLKIFWIKMCLIYLEQYSNIYNFIDFLQKEKYESENPQKCAYS